MKKYILFFLLCNLAYQAKAQWQTNNQLTDLNSWSSQPGFIGWYATTTNTPNGMYYGNGIQTVLPGDNRFGSQIVLPVFDNQMFYRYVQAGTWSPWFNVWSSANFNPDVYLDRSVESISLAGTANSFVNGYTFAYAVTGTPWNGSLISYGGFGGSYDTQINSDYGPNGGKHISFRTMNGDAGTWNSWNEFYHSGNMNRADVDFTAQTVNCTNVYSNGNIWAKQIKVQLTNPWPDYVFKPAYHLPPLSEVKTYIDLNQHLPEMPSDAELAKNGLNLGEIVNIQTKKIEELTLYLIEKNKQMIAQQATNKTLQKEIDELKTQMSALIKLK